jgi:MoxR-like ATPase
MSTLEQIVSTALLVPLGNPNDPNCYWGVPILLWGSPGIGKSTRIITAATRAGIASESVYAATRAPEDFSGVPVPDGKGSISIECILGAVRQLIIDKKGALFLDEISCARPAVQSALLSLVFDRRIGDTRLPGGVRIIAAANPSEEAAGGWELAPPLANRFLHFQVKPPSSDEWVNWLLDEGGSDSINIETSEEIVKEQWPNTFPQAKGIMAGFMKKLGSSNLYKMPKDGDENRGRAWASPRTWEYATRSLATIFALYRGESKEQKSDREHMINDFLEAAVGPGSAKELYGWMKEANLPDPVDMLKKGWTPDKKRLDRTIAAYSQMGSFVLNRPDKQEKHDYGCLAWKQLEVCCEADLPDVALKIGQSLAKGGLGARVTPELRAAASPVLLRFGKTKMADLIAGAV